MASKSVFSNPEYSGAAPRSGFSPDQDRTFTMSTGMLLPVYTKILYPGDKISGFPQFFLRTEQLVRPAMADVDLFVDVFFVPFRHLFSLFDQWYTQIDDRSSDLVSIFSSNDGRLPVVAQDSHAFKWMTKTIFNSYSNIGQSTYSPLVGPGIHRLLDMLGYNPQSIFYNLQAPSLDSLTNILPEYRGIVLNNDMPGFCPYKFMAYQKIYFDYYRDTEFENNKVSAYNLDSVLASGNYSFYPESKNSPYLEIFKLRYRNRSRDYYTNIHVSPLFNGIGMLNNAASNLAKMNTWLSFDNPGISWNGRSVYNEISGSGYFDGSGSGSTGFDSGRWKQQDGNPLSEDNPATTSVDSQQFYYFDSNDNAVDIKHDHSFNVDVQGDVSFEGSMQLASLRGAFAYDKLLRITQMAGKHVDDQIFAHFGVKVPQGISNEVYKLKSYHTLIHFGEVLSTAATDDADLAEMAGKGVAMLGSKEEFDFTVPGIPGICMAIMSASPRYRYIGAVEKDGFKTTLPDFFKPVLDHQGQQPIFGYEFGKSSLTPTDLRGWQWRYMEDKVKINKVSYVFATVSKNPWSMVSEAPIRYNNENVEKWNAVSPHDLHNIFVTVYNQDHYAWPDGGDSPAPAIWNYPVADNYVQWLSSYLTDPFTVDFHMECNVVSEMSTFGEPSLNGI